MTNFMPRGKWLASGVRYPVALRFPAQLNEKEKDFFFNFKWSKSTRRGNTKLRPVVEVEVTVASIVEPDLDKGVDAAQDAGFVAIVENRVQVAGS